MSTLDADPVTEAAFYADLAERVAWRKRREREERALLGVALVFLLLGVVGLARLTFLAVVCYTVGCPT